MAVDTPARVIVVGAGPIGIEAALYARFLGYEVIVFDSGEVGANLQKWGHVPLFTPFGQNSTPLGKSALQAQDENYQPPADDQLLTGRQLLEQYLKPLSQTDLVADCFKLNHKVISIARKEKIKTEDSEDREQRAETPLVTLVEDADGHQHLFESEVVLDCSGVYGQANYIGSGGNPALGELAARDHIHCGVLDLEGSDAQHFANQQTLVIGAGYLAASNVCLLSKLARESMETHVTWITREPKGESGPVALPPNDNLPERNKLIAEANRLACEDDGHIDHWPETTIKAVHYEPRNDHFHVTLEGKHSGVHTFDRIVANVGFRPNLDMLRELQIETSYANESHTAATVHHPEPNFYILGAKSFGRDPGFVLSNGFDQIRQVFSIIGDRENLNLYARPSTDSN
ncbi:NAD(P)-binding domain-containing protein [Bremerella cremea]|uniref:NAD(P)-binding domain-containing protein n=1 Tax=Bremerella cremea TaxID=1031537 RepID=UPI0031E57675